MVTLLFAPLKAKFAELDLNKDGGLDRKELTAARISADAARRFKETDNDL